MESYEIVLCTGGNCGTPNEGKASWTYLQKRVKELNLTNVQLRKSSCLGICALGPTILIYPEETWYNFGRPEVIERILQEHIINGKPVEEFAFAIKEKR